MLCVVTQIRHSNSLKNNSIIPCPEKALMTQKWAPNMAKTSQKTAQTPLFAPAGDLPAVTLQVNH